MAQRVKSRKIGIFGCKSVGKSSLAIRYVQSQFVENYDPTIENTFYKTVHYRDQEYNLELKDTAGLDGSSPFPISSLFNVDGCILVYSITSAKSFHSLKQLREDIIEASGNPNSPTIIVGNKFDLDSEREVSHLEGKRLSDLWNWPYFEVSAKQDKGVNDVFERCLYEIEKSLGNIVEKSSCIIS